MPSTHNLPPIPNSAHVTRRDIMTATSSTQLKATLVCLCIVFGCIIVLAGLAKILEMLRARRGVECAEESATPKDSLLYHPPSSLYTLPNARLPAPSLLSAHYGTVTAFFAHAPFAFASPGKYRPLYPGTTVIQYTKSAPHLQHINAPRLYANRHKRRMCARVLGPTPLRFCVSVSFCGEVVEAKASIKRLPKIMQHQQRQKTHHTHTPLERPASFPPASSPYLNTRSDIPVIQIPDLESTSSASLAVGSSYDDDDSSTPINPTWPSFTPKKTQCMEADAGDAHPRRVPASVFKNLALYNNNAGHGAREVGHVRQSAARSGMKKKEISTLADLTSTTSLSAVWASASSTSTATSMAHMNGSTCLASSSIPNSTASNSNASTSPPDSTSHPTTSTVTSTLASTSPSDTKIRARLGCGSGSGKRESRGGNEFGFGDVTANGNVGLARRGSRKEKEDLKENMGVPVSVVG
ncbi:hypothetical protein R3P38DRAFT_3124785 [Favolaschia claudopus]|uniref:Uncharacterized protein n=1 Tax=Favolaschia claudopus TaxID=2862362 RepID=A0AAV9ZC09_9AGAR